MGCDHDCGSCGETCEKKDFMAKPLPSTKIGKMIAVMSGKGGVGKSMVTDLLAVNTLRSGRKVAVLDADITGPSVPKAFGITEKATATDDEKINPVITKQGIKIMSMNLLLPEDNDPVIWRGPVISGAVKQFFTDVYWQDVDYMYVDMPPGTGDVPLTVFQSLPVNGIVIVTSPQQLVSMIVEKAVNMANLMNIPILGIVENMSYIECPDCKKRINVFGESHIEGIAEKFGIPVLAKLPIDPEIARLCDAGRIQDLDIPEISGALDAVNDIG